MFLLYSPLNQGLKHTLVTLQDIPDERFLLYSPLNQGLKHPMTAVVGYWRGVFTLQSIKSRIETAEQGI